MNELSLTQIRNIHLCTHNYNLVLFFKLRRYIYQPWSPYIQLGKVIYNLRLSECAIMQHLSKYTSIKLKNKSRPHFFGQQDTSSLLSSLFASWVARKPRDDVDVVAHLFARTRTFDTPARNKDVSNPTSHLGAYQLTYIPYHFQRCVHSRLHGRTVVWCDYYLRHGVSLSQTCIFIGGQSHSTTPIDYAWIRLVYNAHHSCRTAYMKVIRGEDHRKCGEIIRLDVLTRRYLETFAIFNKCTIYVTRHVAGTSCVKLG